MTPEKQDKHMNGTLVCQLVYFDLQTESVEQQDWIYTIMDSELFKFIIWLPLNVFILSTSHQPTNRKN